MVVKNSVKDNVLSGRGGGVGCRGHHRISKGVVTTCAHKWRAPGRNCGIWSQHVVYFHRVFICTISRIACSREARDHQVRRDRTQPVLVFPAAREVAGVAVVPLTPCGQQLRRGWACVAQPPHHGLGEWKGVRSQGRRRLAGRIGGWFVQRFVFFFWGGVGGRKLRTRSLRLVSLDERFVLHHRSRKKGSHPEDWGGGGAKQT